MAAIGAMWGCSRGKAWAEKAEIAPVTLLSKVEHSTSASLSSNLLVWNRTYVLCLKLQNNEILFHFIINLTHHSYNVFIYFYISVV